MYIYEKNARVCGCKIEREREKKYKEEIQLNTHKEQHIFFK
jgi:hypothetical protein